MNIIETSFGSWLTFQYLQVAMRDHCEDSLSSISGLKHFLFFRTCSHRVSFRDYLLDKEDGIPVSVYTQTSGQKMIILKKGVCLLSLVLQFNKQDEALMATDQHTLTPGHVHQALDSTINEYDWWVAKMLLCLNKSSAQCEARESLEYCKPRRSVLRPGKRSKVKHKRLWKTSSLRDLISSKQEWGRWRKNYPQSEGNGPWVGGILGRCEEPIGGLSPKSKQTAGICAMTHTHTPLMTTQQFIYWNITDCWFSFISFLIWPSILSIHMNRQQIQDSTEDTSRQL